MHDLLFVYGSLLSYAGHPNGTRLAGEAVDIRPARLRGRLYKISWYPGVVESANPADIVHGELVRLRSPSASLPWLDDYESIGSSDEYERVMRPVALDDGTTAQAWVYLYRRSVDAVRYIADGRWTAHPPGER